MKYDILFNRPCLEGPELEYITQALEHAKLSGDGEFCKRCTRLLAEATGAPCVLLTPSCTHALELSGILLNLQPGDEVILPSFTFVSTANAFLLRGARPVYIDVRPDTLNMDEKLLEELITPKTRAIVPVHYAGVACEMDAIMAIANEHGIAVVEDNAHGLFGAYRGKQLGTFGALATQSFHETKNVHCGEGGALLVNDESLIQRAQIVREKGTNRTQFFLGEVEKYTWKDIGSSYLLSDLNAAFLYAQLEHKDRIQAHRKGIWEAYNTGLADWAAEQGIQQPTVPAHCDQAYHTYYLLLPTPGDRTRFIDHLAQHGIHAAFHYLPLHESDMGKQFIEGRPGCPVTSDITARLVRLPMYNDLSDSDVSKVIESAIRFKSG